MLVVVSVSSGTSPIGSSPSCASQKWSEVLEMSIRAIGRSMASSDDVENLPSRASHHCYWQTVPCDHTANRGCCGGVCVTQCKVSADRDVCAVQCMQNSGDTGFLQTLYYTNIAVCAAEGCAALFALARNVSIGPDP